MDEKSGKTSEYNCKGFMEEKCKNVNVLCVRKSHLASHEKKSIIFIIIKIPTVAIIQFLLPINYKCLQMTSS